MKTMSAREAKNSFGLMIDTARAEPVRIEKHGRGVVVVVSVEDGTATLTGTVDTWYERRSATENAFEGGARAVDNDLRVDYGPAPLLAP